MRRAAAPLARHDGPREVLETMVRAHSAAHGLVQRAQVLLLPGDGVSNSKISEVVGVSRPRVRVWRSDFEKDGLVGFGEVAKGRPRGEVVNLRSVMRKSLRLWI